MTVLLFHDFGIVRLLILQRCYFLLVQRCLFSCTTVLLHATGLLLLSYPIGHVLCLEVIDDQALLLITVVKLMMVKFAGI